MFEEVNKQSLKAREDGNNTETQFTNFWKNNKGNLWKICGGGSLTPESIEGEGRCGVEEIKIIYDSNGTPKEKVWHQYNYDLKTNKTEFASAKAELRGFTQELAALPKTANTEADQNKIKAFYEKWFDVDFFLKTYAVNILVGMDDDYWANNNNYYIYIGKDKDGKKKVWFIPFDYDNTLGASIKKQTNHGGTGDGIFQNPLEWGRGQDSPLMDRILLVPEYKAKFIKFLKEVSSEENHWNTAKLSKQFKDWYLMVEDYLNPNGDLKGGYISAIGLYDGCWNPDNHWLWTNTPNLFDATRESFNRWPNDINTITFDLNGGNFGGNTDEKTITLNDSNRIKPLTNLIDSPEKEGYEFIGWTATKDGEDFQQYATREKLYASWRSTDIRIEEVANDEDGITVKVFNTPSRADIREIYVNGKVAGRTDGQYDESIRKRVLEDEWFYPYTEAGKTYEIYIKYYDSNGGSWAYLNETPIISITAEGGVGEFKVTNTPEFSYTDNTLSFLDPKPTLQLGDYDQNPSGLNCFIEICKTDWWWLSYNNIDATFPDIDFKNIEYVPESARNKDLMFRFVFRHYYGNGEEYWCIVWDYDDTQTKGIKVTN